MKYYKCKCKIKEREIKSERNLIQRKLSERMRTLKNEALESKALEVEECKHESGKMFKAAKALIGKDKEAIFVNDDEGNRIKSTFFCGSNDK